MSIEHKIKVIKMPKYQTAVQQIPDYPMRNIEISFSILLIVYSFDNIEIV